MGVTMISAVFASTRGSAVVSGGSELETCVDGARSIEREIDEDVENAFDNVVASRACTRLVEAMVELFAKREKLFSVSIVQVRKPGCMGILFSSVMLWYRTCNYYCRTCRQQP
jgi:hypothetical protein